MCDNPGLCFYSSSEQFDQGCSSICSVSQTRSHRDIQQAFKHFLGARHYALYDKEVCVYIIFFVVDLRKHEGWAVHSPPQQFCNRAGLGMWVLLWAAMPVPVPEPSWDSVIPPPPIPLPLNSCTALTTVCPLLRAFQAGKKS